MAFAGTKSIILDSALWLIQKKDDVVLFRDPVICSPAFLDNNKKVLEFIGLHFDHSSIGLQENENLLSKLRGRRRIAALFVSQFASKIRANPSRSDYHNIAVEAANEAY